MRIVFVAPSYYPSIGGVEYVVKSVAERLARIGHEVGVVAGDPGAEEPCEEEVNGVEVVRWPVWSPGGAYHFPRKRSKLKRFLRELTRDCDVVHIHSVHSILSVYSLRVVSGGSVRVVVTPHYHGSGHTALRRLLWIVWRRVVAKALSKADIVHAVSPRETSLIAKHYPEVKERIVVIPNGVDEDVYNYGWCGQSSNYMLYAGRIEKYKMLELAVDIAKEMNLKLFVIGRGSYREKLVKYAEKVYREGVEFLEPQPRERYLELLSRARYAINPSRHEAFSIFIAEALAIGTPAIVSKEIAGNLEAESRSLPLRDSLNSGLVLVLKALTRAWNEIIHLYIDKLYSGKL